MEITPLDSPVPPQTVFPAEAIVVAMEKLETIPWRLSREPHDSLLPPSSPWQPNNNEPNAFCTTAPVVMQLKQGSENQNLPVPTRSSSSSSGRRSALRPPPNGSAVHLLLLHIIVIFSSNITNIYHTFLPTLFMFVNTD